MKIVAWILKGAYLIVLLLFAVSHLWGISHYFIGMPAHVGNFEQTVKAIAPPDNGSLRFAVMGDPEDSLEVFQNLLQKAEKNGCQFVIIAGDIVHGGWKGRYLYFLHELAESGFAKPVFSVIGNHDGKEFYNQYMGPEHFWFIHEGSLFLLVDNSSGQIGPEELKWCRDILEQKRKSVKHVFITLHCPLIAVQKDNPNPAPIEFHQPEVKELIDHYNVTIVLAGHFHSYRRQQIGNALHIVTGGAGARLHESDSFFHYVQIDVSGDKVEDLVVRSDVDATDWGEVKRMVVGEIFFLLQAYPILYPPLLAILALGAWWWLRARKKRMTTHQGA